MAPQSQTVTITEQRPIPGTLAKSARTRIGQRRKGFTDAEIVRIRHAARVGLSAHSIAHLIGTDQRTIERNFAEVIEQERVSTEVIIADKLTAMATDGKLGAATYWLDRRGGDWQQRQTPATNAVQVVVNLSDTLRQAMASLEGVKRVDAIETVPNVSQSSQQPKLKP